jgi:hypothetical protein
LKIQNQATFPSKPRSYEISLPGVATVGYAIVSELLFG